MFITPRIICSVSLAVALFSGTAWAAGLSVQGEVKGPDRKPIKGADVRIERKGSAAPVGAVKTNQQGQYVFKALAVGTYTVTVSANGMASTSVEKVQPREEGAVRIDFNLSQAGTGQAGTPPKKKAKHMVWMAAQTGTNIGGRWVEVDDGGNLEADSASGVKKRSGAVLGKMQGGGNRTGGN